MTFHRTRDAIVNDLLRHVKTGGTVATVAGGLVPSSGYVVGVPQHGMTSKRPTEGLVAAWVTSVALAASEPSRYVGIWSHDDITYLDVVEVLPEMAMALSEARKRGEIAIFNLSTQEEILV